MMVDSVLSTGLAGIASGIAGAQQAAQDIATATTVDSPTSDRPSGDSAVDSDSPASIVDLTEAVVQLQSSELQVQASAEVVASADEVLGTLLNIKA